MLKHLLFRYEWNRPGLDLLLWGEEFSRKLETRSRQAVLVNTTEYIIRRTSRLSSHLFAANTHPPLYAYVLTCLYPLQQRAICVFTHTYTHAHTHAQATFVNTVPCLYPPEVGAILLPAWRGRNSVSKSGPEYRTVGLG